MVTLLKSLLAVMAEPRKVEEVETPVFTYKFKQALRENNFHFFAVAASDQVQADLEAGNRFVRFAAAGGPTVGQFFRA